MIFAIVVRDADIYDALFASVRRALRAGATAVEIQADLDAKFGPILASERSALLADPPILGDSPTTVVADPNNANKTSTYIKPGE